MNFTLTKGNVNNEICNWFEQHLDELPETLDCETMYIGSVKFQAELWIYQVLHSDTETELVAKDGLKKMYKALQNQENWNKPMQRIGE